MVGGMSQLVIEKKWRDTSELWEWMNECMNDSGRDGRINKWLSETTWWINGWINEWMDGGK